MTLNQETIDALRDQVTDAEEAITGLRPEDAIIHLGNIEAMLDEAENELEDSADADDEVNTSEGMGAAYAYCG